MFLATGDSKESSSSQWPQPCRLFEFAEILLATKDFDESLVIGRGGFGKVYKGTIVNGPSPVVAAIKRLDSMSNQGATEFWAEVEMLSKLRHCHLVSLLGYCNDAKEMIIVYEYMPHGTLEDHLHKLHRPLSWLQRLQICIGAARGLDYLHTGTGIEHGVIHRDVKSSNILLHESWEAKISDFGLSRTGPKNQPTTHVSTLVKGTFGYLDPDYFRTGRLTRKSDVYAFGVILFEVLCRKRAVDTSLDEEEWGLARWAQDSVKEGSLKNKIDYDLRNQISAKCLKEFSRIADRCLHDHPKQRPTMAEVVFTLESVLALQKKAYNSLQHAGKTIFSKMVDMLIFPSKGEHSAHADLKLSSNSKHNSTSAGVPSPSLQVFNLADLKSATNDFSPDRLLIKGYSGKVFLGCVPSLPGVEMAVAVKRCGRSRAYDWMEKVSFLGQLAHPNVVSLLGYCKDEREKLLVYENMRDRSLDRFLFGYAEPLSWRTRLNIMIGVVRGLVYLHSSEVGVVHTDLTSSSVFLDQDFNPKVGDLELALHEGVCFGTTVCFGNFGYMDPEFYGIGCSTPKNDVYSFGVLLLETLTCQRSLAMEQPEEPRFLAEWVCFLAESGELKEGGLEKIMDPHLKHEYPIDGAFKCFELAIRCVARNLKDRPSSEEVLQSLEAIDTQ